MAGINSSVSFVIAVLFVAVPTGLYTSLPAVDYGKLSLVKTSMYGRTKVFIQLVEFYCHIQTSLF